MTNLEGGVDPEEFRSAAVIDRVNTTATVWLGTTLACAQCHNHKYDPFSQKEYFQLYAFLDSTEDSGSSLEPRLRAPTPEQEAELERLQREVDRLEGELTAPWPDARGEQEAWEVAARFSALAPPDREGLPGPVRAALVLEPDERGEDQRAVLERHWRREVSPRGRALKAELDAAGAARDAQEGAIPMALVLRELEDPRETRLFVRGSFLSPGEAAERDVPAVLNPWPEGAPRNRLGLARWLVDRPTR